MVVVAVAVAVALAVAVAPADQDKAPQNGPKHSNRNTSAQILRTKTKSSKPNIWPQSTQSRNTKPNYNAEGETKALYCSLHKKQGMENVNEKVLKLEFHQLCDIFQIRVGGQFASKLAFQVANSNLSYVLGKKVHYTKGTNRGRSESKFVRAACYSRTTCAYRVQCKPSSLGINGLSANFLDIILATQTRNKQIRTSISQGSSKCIPSNFKKRKERIKPQEILKRILYIVNGINSSD